MAKTPGPSEVEKAFRWAPEEGAFMRAHPEILALPEVQALLRSGMRIRQKRFKPVLWHANTARVN